MTAREGKVPKIGVADKIIVDKYQNRHIAFAPHGRKMRDHVVRAKDFGIAKQCSMRGLIVCCSQRGRIRAQLRRRGDFSTPTPPARILPCDGVTVGQGRGPLGSATKLIRCCGYCRYTLTA